MVVLPQESIHRSRGAKKFLFFIGTQVEIAGLENALLAECGAGKVIVSSAFLSLIIIDRTLMFMLI